MDSWRRSIEQLISDGSDEIVDPDAVMIRGRRKRRLHWLRSAPEKIKVLLHHRSQVRTHRDWSTLMNWLTLFNPSLMKQGGYNKPLKTMMLSIANDMGGFDSRPFQRFYTDIIQRNGDEYTVPLPKMNTTILDDSWMEKSRLPYRAEGTLRRHPIYAGIAPQGGFKFGRLRNRRPKTNTPARIYARRLSALKRQEENKYKNFKGTKRQLSALKQQNEWRHNKRLKDNDYVWNPYTKEYIKKR